jgi:WD40 repeat protein
MQINHLHTCTGHRAALYALAPGATARQVLTAGGDGWIVEWKLDDPETGLLAASVETQVFSLCSLPERNLIVAGNMNGGVHWIDRTAPERTRNVQHHRSGVYDLKVAGDWLFSAGGDGLLSRWSLETGRATESFQLSNQGLRCLAWSSARNELAVGASDNSIYLLDAHTLAVRRKISGAHANSVFTVAYSPDDRFLLSGGRDAHLKIWEPEKEFALKLALPAHWFTLNHLCFSPDGRYFATASRDKTIKIWSAETFELLKVVETIRDGGHIRSVNRLLWLPGCLLSCSDDRTMIIWNVVLSDK